MANEIERKYLIKDDRWQAQADQGLPIIQAYMGSNAKSSVRIRLCGNQANLNIKSKTIGISRREYEYPIALDDAKQMLTELCDRPFIEKTRYHVQHQQQLWEIDVFAGENDGLVIAEIELLSPDQSFELPAWVGAEVSTNPRYYNVALVTHPYKNWAT